MPKHHEMDDIPEKKTLNFWFKLGINRVPAARDRPELNGRNPKYK